MGVVIGVHCGSAYVGSSSHMSFLAGFTDIDVLMIFITYLTYGSSTFHANFSNFSGGQPDLRIGMLLCHELRTVSCGSNQLSASARLHLDVVDHRAHRDVCQGKGVAHLDIRIGAGEDHVSDLQVFRGQDVSLLAVRIYNQRDVGTSVGTNCSPLCKLPFI